MKRLRYRSNNLCQLCEFVSVETSPRCRFARPYSLLVGIVAHHWRPQQQLTPRRGHGVLLKRLNFPSRRWISDSRSSVTEEAVKRQLHALRQQVHAILSSKTETVISEDNSLGALQALQTIARALIGTDSPEARDGTTPVSALLSLDGNASQAAVSQVPPPQDIPSHYRLIATDEISKLAYDILKHPGVFISPAILNTYVSIQTLLGHPETLPEAFILYARKPIPKPNTPPTQYKIPNPNKASSATPTSIADIALTAAIEKKDLSLALAIIDRTVCTPAFHRSKIIRKALPPLTGFALAPVAVYTLASQLSVYQESMDSAMATNVAFAGILAYVGFTATIGIVAVTTANDQMDRVTWATGMPLRDRWLREEERAALDRVAGAWGFKEPWRRGEEDGREWEELREFIGRRGMVLDRVELMEGME